jgi:protoporphyrinogen oxidase
MAKIVIIGAGPTGLSAAYHLEKKGFFDYKLFEKEATTGGLCRSVTQDGFTFDFTGHLLHIGDPYFKNFIETIVGMDNFNTITRKSFIYSENTYTKYPYQINLHGLPTKTIVECIEGYINRPKTKKNPRTFIDWVMHNFGPGIGKHFFFPYQKKIFAYDLDKISTSWTGRFVPQTSLPQILHGALEEPSDDLVGYNATFFYPKHDGISFWVDKLAQTLKNTIHTNHCVQFIDSKNKIVQFTNGHEEKYEQLITTMPLDRLLTNLQEPSSSHLARAANKLLCNKVVNFNLGIARPNLSEKHWIYYPEEKYPFYRIGFSNNFAESMAPAGHSSLYGEFSYIQESEATVQRMLELSLKETKKVLGIAESEIVTEKIIYIDHAYVIYDFWREKNLAKIHKKLNDTNIYSVGRYGEWKYSSMQEAVLDGKKIADSLVVIPATEADYMHDILDYTNSIEQQKAV